MARDGYEHVLTEPQLTELERAQARITSLEGVRDKMVECNALAASMGYDHTMAALLALQAMKRGPRSLSSESSDREA
jgi:hypothetical protein